MTSDQWSEIDEYFAERLLPADPVLDAVLHNNAANELPAIDVSPCQGKLLHLLVKMHGARSVLEIGTLGGYSTIWMARALPRDGRLVTLELEPDHASIARDNLEAAGVAALVDLRVGDALQSLQSLKDECREPFDLVFIDADKQNNALYFSRALQLARPGTVIIVDNVVRGGAVLDADSDEPDVVGVRQMFELLENEPRVTATALQSVGVKGHDGFLLSIVN